MVFVDEGFETKKASNSEGKRHVLRQIQREPRNEPEIHGVDPL